MPTVMAAKSFAMFAVPQAPLFPLADGSPGDPKQALAKLVRWTFDLDGSTDDFSREQLHDVVCEFPRLDERRTGLSYRYGYFSADSKPAAKVGGFNQIARVDHQTGSIESYDVGTVVLSVNPYSCPNLSPLQKAMAMFWPMYLTQIDRPAVC